MKEKSLSRGRVLETPWTAAYQAPPFMGFSRQEYWSGLPLPSPNYQQLYTNKMDNLEDGSNDSGIRCQSLKLLEYAEKAMATHSSILAWRIPEKGEPGGLPSMGLHRVGHY